MKLKHFLLLTLLLPLTASSGFAEEIGRSSINGRVVIIDGNGTWKYDGAQAAAGVPTPADCTGGSVVKSKKLPVSLCVSAPWKLDSTAPGSMEFQVLNNELDAYFGLITERTAIPLAGLRQAILINAAQGSGVTESDILIASESKVTIGGHEWSYIEYHVTFGGAKYRFANYYSSLGDKGVVQGVFWCSDAYFEQNKSAITKFMSAVQLQL
jgi:hypothetical protein